MNRNRAKELLPIIQAFAEGKDIQYRPPSEDRWCDFPSGYGFNDHEGEYRIKPEPFECWVNVYDGRLSDCTWPTKEAANRGDDSVKTIHMREVE
jgi:hypothetical protein